MQDFICQENSTHDSNKSSVFEIAILDSSGNK